MQAPNRVRGFASASNPVDPLAPSASNNDNFVQTKKHLHAAVYGANGKDLIYYTPRTYGMNRATFSVVTLSFNQSAYLQQAIESVLMQEGDFSVEYIIVDPGSTDNSRELIQRYEHRVDRLILTPDAGPADGLNKGFSLAKGSIFYYLNADDYLLPGALSIVARYFESEPSSDFVLAAVDLTDSIGNILKTHHPCNFNAKRLVRGSSVVAQQGTFFKRQLWDAGFRFNVNNRTCWDSEFLIDCMPVAPKFGVLGQTVACFRIYPDSITGSGRMATETALDRTRMFEKVFRRPIKWWDSPIYWLERAFRNASQAHTVGKRLARKFKRPSHTMSES